MTTGYQFVALNADGRVSAYSNVYASLDEAKYVGKIYASTERKQERCEWFILGPYQILSLEGEKMDNSQRCFTMLQDLGYYSYDNSVTTNYPIPYIFDRSPVPKSTSRFYVAVVQWPESGASPTLLNGVETNRWGEALKQARLLSYTKNGPGPVFRGIVERRGKGQGVLGHISFAYDEQEVVYDKRGKLAHPHLEDSILGKNCMPSVAEVDKCSCTTV